MYTVPCHDLLAVARSAPLAFLLTSAAVAQRPLFDTVHDMLPMYQADTEVVALGDLDGDGDLDAIVGVGLYASDRVWRNDGTGVFVDDTATSWPGDAETSTAIELGDVDSDGDLDAWVAELGRPSRLYLNDGAGRFLDATASQLPAGQRFPSAVELGDVDGDGDLDAFVGQGARLRNELFLNDGRGRFTDASSTHLPFDQDVTFSVELGDVDGDGDLDAVLGTFNGPDRLYRNDGVGRFTDATAGNLPSPSASTRALELGDVDSDGDLDIFAGDMSAQNRLYLNSGAGLFTEVTATHLPALQDLTFAARLLDADGDGDLDVFVGNFSEGDRLLLNDGHAMFSDGTAGRLPDDPDRAVLELAVGDVDGDGDLDLLVADAFEPNDLLLNDGAGRFTSAVRPAIRPLYEDTFAVAAGDVDGDGDQDLLFGNGHPFSFQPNRLFLFDVERGAFAPAAAGALPARNGPTQGLALGDVDGDGDLDAVIGNAASTQNRLLRNDGRGVFLDVTAASMPPILDETYEVVMGDVDGDGDLDVWLGNWGARDGLLRNDGTGVFTDASANLPAVQGPTTGIALGDVDGDGDLDAFVTHAGQQNRLYRNDGHGVFSDATTGNLPARIDGSEQGALGDLDGDGDLDAFVANRAGQDRVLRNDGTGRFTDITAAALPPRSGDSTAVVLDDLDLDGDLDAAVGVAGAPTILYVNDGSGVFVDGPAASGGRWSTERIALADVDRDGDVDLLVANSGFNEFHPNLTRHLAWRGLPRVGKPLTLDVECAGCTLFALNLAVGTARIPTVIGTVRIDPGGLIAAVAGTLDPLGHGELTVQVPANASLVGLELAWQAIVALPLGLTNLETTRFLDV